MVKPIIYIDWRRVFNLKDTDDGIRSRKVVSDAHRLQWHQSENSVIRWVKWKVDNEESYGANVRRK